MKRTVTLLAATVVFSFAGFAFASTGTTTVRAGHAEFPLASRPTAITDSAAPSPEYRWATTWVQTGKGNRQLQYVRAPLQ
ncbi:MAG: hypothetical protein ACYC26_03275 [Phycisphaerales bacterium]